MQKSHWSMISLDAKGISIFNRNEYCVPSRIFGAKILINWEILKLKHNLSLVIRVQTMSSLIFTQNSKGNDVILKKQKLFALLRFFPYASPFCNLSLASVQLLSRCFSTYWPTMLSILSIPPKVLLFYIYKESVACEFSFVFYFCFTADIFHNLCRVRIWQTLFHSLWLSHLQHDRFMYRIGLWFRCLFVWGTLNKSGWGDTFR